MSTNGSPGSSALVSELSFSFQDELTATIHNAFGVAVEIAVIEITKLVGQALGDVRDQMHETLRENKSLKQRLQSAELEVCALRGRANDQSNLQPLAVGKFSLIDETTQVHLPPLPHIDSLQSQPTTGKQKQQRTNDSKQPIGTLLSIDERYSFLAAEEEVDGQHKKSFCEIREDGRVCSHDLNSEVGVKSKSTTEPQEAAASQDNSSGLFPESQVDRVQFEHAQSRANPVVDTTMVLVEGQTLPNAVCHKSEVEQPLEVKEESPDLACASGSAPFVGGEDDIGPDSLSLAQSKLLEDWRPEPLHLQNCDPDSLIPCTTHSLSDSTVFNPEIPDVLSPASSGMPLPFSKPYPSGDTAGLSISGQPFSSQVTEMNSKIPAGNHVCKVCGEVFHVAGELRKHRMQHHNPTTNRNPKRQIFPPGRSPYHCSLCGRDFNRMEHLKIHQRIHTGERPYACSVCNARFRHSWALTRHFRIHTGEKPYACSQCGKTFRNCGGLRFHQRSHSIGGVA
ncbi:hypothetical protein AGOR_G00025870 [Albula goreensis]|uniref:C2H2-type domain-containing protein n=1 Tax=Albula goreensis TaxID=1534307 RepID=A0A8T3E8Y3_9TELE|nr:hypothetical protein AGOR_G00025870 [Albula goreensis]